MAVEFEFESVGVVVDWVVGVVVSVVGAEVSAAAAMAGYKPTIAIMTKQAKALVAAFRNFVVLCRMLIMFAPSFMMCRPLLYIWFDDCWLAEKSPY